MRQSHDMCGRIRALSITLVLNLVCVRAAVAQYRLRAPSGEEIMFPRDSLLVMLDSTRALYRDLQDDPRVLYYTDVGADVSPDSSAAAYPWNAVQVRNDSVAAIQTPNNLREADRAYFNYAVRRMRVVRNGDPDVSCDSLMRVEAAVVSSFVDGWIVARTLFGGPSFEPLDRLAFARAHGLLPAVLAASGDTQLGACAPEWAARHADILQEYRTWYDQHYRAPPAARDAPPSDSMPSVPERASAGSRRPAGPRRSDVTN